MPKTITRHTQTHSRMLHSEGHLSPHPLKKKPTQDQHKSVS